MGHAVHILSTDIHSKPAALTIVHTNDMHSHLLAGPSNSDYTPEQTEDDQTGGGWARIATVIKSVRASRDNPVLVLGAGEFLMGSLFHMLNQYTNIKPPTKIHLVRFSI